ncbi:MAG: cysteine desulfurase NifS [Candidatus Methanoperedens sp.]|nr:cysteine desulfurase NifS [Candidatus Methanoperedens sp.]MCE8425562.1 cysteine desulfurase NifS [Candidatus Methanoperedens sp.]MCE8427480.1 cysteine desulfurase NifS [Candidatus Methanoperedens sp.]
MTHLIYMDNSATTAVDPGVTEAMLPYFSENFGNPSSLYSIGRQAKRAIEEARQKVADLIGAKKEEIIFTGSGTESDNLAIKGTAYRNRKKGDHIITSSIEHHAVLHTCKYLESQGFKVTYLPVNKEGLVNPVDVEKAITPETILITIMHANNEIGTIQPIEEIGKIANEKNIIFHTDAVQTIGKLPINADTLGVSLLSMSAHKIYGPKGVGALYIRKGTVIESQMHGGGHERNIRSGTENVPGIVGFGKAAELAKVHLPEEEKLANLRNSLIKGIFEIKESYLNGHPTKRLPGNANFRFSYVEGESLILSLDMKGVAASTGSACSSTSLTPSHVLIAIGLRPEEAHGSLRLTLGRENTQEEVDHVVSILPDIVNKLRMMSPLAR